jgi:isopenicillin N synthase-like dioxygenase
METLAGGLMEGFALALDLPIKWFEPKFNKHASALRSLNYPDLTHLGVVPEPGQMRASAHTDYGVLTILKSGGPGLQVKGRDQEVCQHWVQPLPNVLRLLLTQTTIPILF